MVGSLIAVAPLVLEQRLQDTQASVVTAPGHQSTGSVAVAHGFSCSAARGIFPDQESNPYLLHWQADSLPLSQQPNPGIWIMDMKAAGQLNTGEDEPWQFYHASAVHLWSLVLAGLCYLFQQSLVVV